MKTIFITGTSTGLGKSWELGSALSDKQQRAAWGDKMISQLAKDLSEEFGAKGFSSTQLKYMRRWYQFYNPIGLQAVDQIQLTGKSLHLVESSMRMGIDKNESYWGDWEIK